MNKTLSGHGPSSSSSLKSILNQLNFSDSDSLDECHRLYEQAKENALEMIDLTRSNLLERGITPAAAIVAPSGDPNDLLDAELNAKLVQMRTAHQSSAHSLDSLRAHLTHSLAQEKIFNELHSRLKDFIALKSSQLDDAQLSVSAQLAKIVEQRQEHEAFNAELVATSDDVKRLIEHYSAKIIESDDESVDAQSAHVINELEASWNGLCAKSDARKEKLYVNFSMAEQFEKVHADLSRFLAEMRAFLAVSRPSLVQLKERQAELSGEKRLNLTKLNKIGGELQHASHSGKEEIEARTNAIAKKFSDLEDELRQLSEFETTLRELESNINLDQEMLALSLAPQLDQLKLKVTFLNTNH